MAGQASPRNVLAEMSEDAESVEAEAINGFVSHLDTEIDGIATKELLSGLRVAKREDTADLRAEKKAVSKKLDRAVAQYIKTPTDELRQKIFNLQSELEAIEEELAEVREPHNEDITPVRKEYSVIDGQRVEEAVDLYGGDYPEKGIEDIPVEDEDDS